MAAPRPEALEDEAIALAALERAVESGASEKTLDKLHRRVEQAREQVSMKTKMSAERERIVREITLRKNAERQTALQRKGQEAAQTVRESGHFGMALRYKGITVVCNPSATADPAVRLNALASFRSVVHFLNAEAERDVMSASLVAQGKTPADSWTVEAIVRRVSDDMRMAIAHGCASISVGRTE